MPDDGRLIELMSQMLEEQKLMRSEQQETNRRLVKQEEQQQVTNTILRQHSRDLERIADLLSERVPHWGDSILIESKTGTVAGTLKKTG
jgi:hypothetical protein